MPSAPVNGTELYYLQDGQGEDVVLVHGLASHHAFWYSGVMVPLRRRYRVTAYDLRGHGKSAMPTEGYTHVAMADDLAALLDHLGIARCHLIGHSYGGLVALTFALGDPQRLLSLTLADVPVDTGAASGGRADHPEKSYPELDLLEKLARMPVREHSGHAPFSPFGGGRVSSKTAKLWLRLLETTHARSDFRSRSISLAELQNFQVPTLLTYGFDSGWKRSGEILRSHLPDTSLVYIRNSGHAHPWEKPGFFLRSWQDFIDAAARRPTPDRRGHLRNHVCLLLEMHPDEGTACGVETVNVSMTGLLLNSPVACAVGTPVRLFERSNGHPLTVEGRVVRQENCDNLFQLAIDFEQDGEGGPLFLGFVQEIINALAPGEGGDRSGGSHA
ncbi:MAG: alpha/beta fold hydrolase [Thermodesulfobacteriota bacterium]